MKYLIVLSVCGMIHFSVAMQQESINNLKKKRSLIEALDRIITPKKRKFPLLAQQNFDAAMQTNDFQRAHRILKDNYYSPFQISIEQAIRSNNLEDFIFWLFAPRNNELLGANSTCAFRTSSALGNTRFMKILLKMGVPLDTEDTTGWTALNFAVWHNRADAVCLLLEHGAAENKLNLHDRTPLYYLMPLFKSSNYPFEAALSLATTFICHAQWNERPPILDAPDEEYNQALVQPNTFFSNIDEAASIKRFFAVLLSLKRVCPALPRDLRHKILSYLAEDIYSEQVLNALYSQIEKNSNALRQVVEICPIAWLKKLSCQKQLSSLAHEYTDFLEKLAPLIVQYRLRRSQELLPHLPEPHKSFIGTCIKSLENEKRGMIEQAVMQELRYPKGNL
jgi:hypothetical protein